MKRLAALLACVTLCTAAAAAQDPEDLPAAEPSRPQARPCLTEPELQAVATWLVPDAVDGLARRCRRVLSPRSFLLGSGPALAARFRRDTGPAGDLARQALRRVAGDSPLSLFGDSFTGALIVEGALDRLKPQDCATADRLTALLSPLPVASLGEIAALVAAAGLRNARNRPLPVQICRSATR